MSKENVLIKSGKKFRFEMREKPEPELPENGIIVEVHAAGVNFADVMMSLGIYPDAPKLPAAPGYEVAGIVSEAGRKSEFKKGDRVGAFSHFGGYTDTIALQDKQVVKLPKSLPFEKAAAIPVNYSTAAVALLEMGRVKKDDWVLIHGGAGGVGSLAIQLAKLEKAKVIATVGSDAKFKAVKKLGADKAVNYREENFSEKALDITGRKGVDIILDPIGGRNLKKSFSCLALTGRVILFGLADAVKNGKASKPALIRAFLKSLKFSPMLLMNENHGIYGLNMVNFFGSPAEDMIRDILARGMKHAASGKLDVNIGGTYPLENAQDALRDLLSRKTRGKLILKCR